LLNSEQSVKLARRTKNRLTLLSKDPSLKRKGSVVLALVLRLELALTTPLVYPEGLVEKLRACSEKLATKPPAQLEKPEAESWSPSVPEYFPEKHFVLP
jgi:hypothetical protein